MKQTLLKPLQSMGRTVRTLGRIVAAVWTRRLPNDEELFHVAWQLALLGVAVLFLLMAIGLYHDSLAARMKLDSFIDRYNRLVVYAFWRDVSFVAIESMSIALGMWISKRRRFVLIWLVPQMVFVLSYVWVWNGTRITSALYQRGLFMSQKFNSVEQVISAWSIFGAIAVTACWTWWALTPTEAERLAKEIVAEQAAHAVIEATPPSEPERQP